MGAIELLERYRHYLEALDDEAARVADDEDYLDLLTEGEAIDLLCTRDELAEERLSPELQMQLTGLAQLPQFE